MNRARRKDESYDEYREALRQEERDTKLWLQGIPQAEALTPLEFMQFQQKAIANMSKEINSLEAERDQLKARIDVLEGIKV